MWRRMWSSRTSAMRLLIPPRTLAKSIKTSAQSSSAVNERSMESTCPRMRLMRAMVSSLFEIHPCGQHQQDNHHHPEGRTTHFCFLRHELHFKSEIASMCVCRVAECAVVVNRILVTANVAVNSALSVQNSRSRDGVLGPMQRQRLPVFGFLKFSASWVPCRPAISRFWEG